MPVPKCYIIITKCGSVSATYKMSDANITNLANKMRVSKRTIRNFVKNGSIQLGLDYTNMHIKQ